MDRTWIVNWWNEAWKSGLWAAAWSKSLEGLTPQQAAWSPAPGRKSIWQMVNHMTFWRENWLGKVAGKPKAGPEEVERRNWEAPTEISAAAWERALARFKETQQRMAAALTDPASPIDSIAYFLPHDSYHFGQVNYLRAMQGLPPIE
jgi:uncharacterized damage-inducible protein DinB